MRSLQEYYSSNPNLCKQNSLEAFGSYLEDYSNSPATDLNGLSYNEVMPTCYIVTASIEDIQFFKFTQKFQALSEKVFKKEKMPQKHCEDNWWIMKPANLNQGRGIEISNDITSIKKFLSHQLPNSLWVIQKYLEKPLLYHKRKFDIRLWVLVS